MLVLALGVVELEEPELPVDPDVPELVELPEFVEPADPVLEVDEPEPLLVELGVVEPLVAANATPVPTPARTPVRSRPAAACLRCKFTVSTSFLVARRWGCRHLEIATRGRAVRSLRCP
jgi:hypothetical protein